MLDTNMASYVIKGDPPEARLRLAALPMESIIISVVTQAELLYGLARKGHPVAFSALIREFLNRVKILPWDEGAATVYGNLRASCAAAGVTLSALDMLIAAHAIAAKATLVTHDKAFSLVPDGALAVEDWITSPLLSGKDTQIPNALTAKTLRKSKKGEDISKVVDSDDLFEQLDI